MGIYRIVLDPATHLEVAAAIAHHSAPHPTGTALTDDGHRIQVPDPRTPTQRRADAFADLILIGASGATATATGTGTATDNGGTGTAGPRAPQPPVADEPDAADLMGDPPDAADPVADEVDAAGPVADEVVAAGPVAD